MCAEFLFCDFAKDLARNLMLKTLFLRNSYVYLSPRRKREDLRNFKLKFCGICCMLPKHLFDSLENFLPNAPLTTITF